MDFQLPSLPKRETGHRNDFAIRVLFTGTGQASLPSLVAGDGKVKKRSPTLTGRRAPETMGAMCKPQDAPRHGR
jgi:hypothetical protein